MSDRDTPDTPEPAAPVDADHLIAADAWWSPLNAQTPLAVGQTAIHPRLVVDPKRISPPHEPA